MPTPQPHHIKTVGSKVVYAGFNRITNYTFEFPSFDGKKAFQMEKEVFERKNAVAVLLYDPVMDGVVLVQQFRPGCFIAQNIAFPLEIPAGLIDTNDGDLEEIARKEAIEETHYDIQSLIKIGCFFPEISFSSRIIHLFCGKIDASKAHINGGLHEESEDIHISLVPVAQLRKSMEEGELMNSHTLIAVQWFFLNLEKVRKSFSDSDGAKTP